MCCSGRRYWGGGIFGIFLVAIGVGFLLQNFGYLHLDWDRLWPVWLILWGVLMLVGNLSGGRLDRKRGDGAGDRP